jgi:HEAT repeat protein
MKTSGILFTTFLGCMLASPSAFSFETALLSPEGAPASSGAKDDNLYSDGTRAINEGRWADAEAAFAKVAAMHGEHEEGAMYWQAYARSKRGELGRAMALCGELKQKHPNSRWNDECGALQIEISGKSGHPAQLHGNQDDELKLLALNALMQQDEARAIPAIQSILNSDRPDKLKEHALFVLAQSQSKQAQDLLAQVARNNANPDLQVKAIHMEGTRGNQSNQFLADIYKQSTNDRVKKAVLESYLMTGNTDKLFEVARHESDPQLAETAVNILGATGATTELLNFYRESNNAQIKGHIINALVASGSKGAEALKTIASSEQDPELRKKAVRNLGVTGGSSVGPFLVAIYQKSPDAGTRKAALEGLFISGDAHDLVTLAREEKDPALKQAIVQQLSLMHNPEANAYLVELLNK